jgi:acetoin:2,6-dichlorophenolindophenol oxidoreductase subunit beta
MTQLSLTQAYQLGLREEMRADPTIFVMGTDLLERGGHWGQVKGFGEEFGSARIRDTPISEAAMVAAGVGAALNGMRPVVDLNFIDFIFGAIDEVVNQAAKIRYMWGAPVPLVIRGSSGVSFGGPQHSNSLEAWFTHIPGLLVVAPATPADTRGLIKSALRGEDPVIFLMHKMLTGVRGDISPDQAPVPIGRARIARAGRDCTVIAYSITVSKALQAAEQLAQEGVEAEVIDLRTVFPIDMDLISESVRKTSRVVVVGEAPRHGSVASEVAAEIQETLFDELDGPVLRVGGLHAPIPHSPPLFEALIPQVADIHRAVRRLVQ